MLNSVFPLLMSLDILLVLITIVLLLRVYNINFIVEENVTWVLIRNSIPVYPFEKIMGMTSSVTSG